MQDQTDGPSVTTLRCHGAAVLRVAPRASHSQWRFQTVLSPRVLWKAEGREPLWVEEDLLGLEQGSKGTESQRDAAGQAAAVDSKNFSLGVGHW